MTLENNQPESVIAEPELAFNPEELWGGKESEWAHWEKAERFLSNMDFLTLQNELVNSEANKQAYEKVYGTSVKEVSENMLADFFSSFGGPVYFRRRYYQNRKDLDPAADQQLKEDIAEYYTKKSWEKDLKDWSDQYHSIYH